MTRYWACSLTVILLLSLFISCSKTSDIGHIVRPSEDAINVVTDSFILKTSTIHEEHLYSETTKPVLGHYTDNIYGEFKVDFLSEFRYVKDLTFGANAVSDSLYLVIYYKSFFGDSSSVQEATAYQLDRAPLNFSADYYSDIDISEYCSRSVVLGRRSYVAYDQTITSTERDSAGYCNTVKIKMPHSMANEMLSRTDIYKSQDDFVNFFKGVYVTNTFGQQTVLLVDSVNLELSYRYNPDAAKVDSFAYAKAIFPSNRETSQVIHVSGKPTAIYSKPDSVEYMSCPGGTFVKVEIPFERMYERMVEPYFNGIDSLNLNNFKLIFEPAQYEDEDDKSQRMAAPLIPILVRAADMEPFFTQSLYPAPNIETTLAWNMGDDDAPKYVFVNSASAFEVILRKATTMTIDERKAYFSSLNPYYIVPVTGATDVAGTNAVIRHMYHPYGVRVRSGLNPTSPMRIVVTFTNL